MNFFDRLVPKAYRHLLQFVPGLAFRVVDWSDFLRAMGQSVRYAASKETTKKAILELQSCLGDKIKIVADGDSNAQTPTNELQKNLVSQAILRVYFLQLTMVEPINLDLRAAHFSIDATNQVFWKPSWVWTQLREDFRVALIDVYRAFYQGDDAALLVGLAKLKLYDSDWPNEQKERILALLRDHFGVSGDQTDVRFHLKSFQESFERLFEALDEYKMRLDSQFLFLGIYLITLYESLDNLGARLNVRSIVEETLKIPQKKG